MKTESRKDTMWKIAFITIALLCFTLATSLVTFMILKRNSNDKRIVEFFEFGKIENKRSEEEAKLKFVPEEQDLKKKKDCQFGFDFLIEKIDKGSKRGIDKKKRRLLPEHLKANFTGALVNQDLMCLDTMDATENQWIGIFECHGQGRNQAITFTTDGFIMSSGTTKTLCLALKNMVSTFVVLKKCNKLDDTQIWSKDSVRGLIKPIVRKDYCLNAPQTEEGNIAIDTCSIVSPSQRWHLVMNEVLALWVDGALRTTNSKKQKKYRNTRKQMDKLILQSRPTNKMEIYDPLDLA